nr:zinc finger, CCHC-type, retrotransposon Gag domain protein [Tanacetum cinerariifolium]
MARLAFCDYHNIIAILEKSEHNVDFHQIVDFVEASYIRFALTINPTVYVSHIRQFWSTARIETMNEGTKILATIDGKPMTISKSSIRRNLKLNDEEGISSLPDAELFENLALMGYNILPNQKFTFQKDEPVSLLRDDSQGEAFPTVSSLDTEMASKINAQDLGISNLKAKIKLLEDKDKGSADLSGDDALIKGRSMEIGEEAGVEKGTKRESNDTKELVNVLTSMDATNILTSRVQAVSVPSVAEVSTVGVPTVSGLVPTVSAIFTTASVVTPYSRCLREISAKDKGKEKMVKSDMPKKKKLQEQIDEQMARQDQRMDDQIVRDAEIARIHAEEELQMLIDGLDRNNKVIAKHLQEYEQSEAELTIGEKIDLINELVKYQDHHAKILKYQAQQGKLLSKKEQRKFYMSVLRSHFGWKTKHFRGMTLEEIREKFIPVWKQIEDFVPMASKEEGERVKRKGLKLEQGSTKKIKTSEDVSEEDLKEMMQLVPVEEVYVEALQNRDQQYNCSSASSTQKKYTAYTSPPPCDTCGKPHPGKECYRVTGACFSYGLTGHMANNFPKNNRGNRNDKRPNVKGKV